MLWGTLFVALAIPGFYSEVQPLLAKHCQGCHVDGGIAPMAFTDFASVRPWAKSIREQVRGGKMPPFDAVAAPGHFVNDSRMSKNEVATIVRWVEGGAPEGRRVPVAAQPLPAMKRADWDLRLQAPVQSVKEASGYRHLILEQRFDKGRWVEAIEIAPSNRAVVHHAVLFVRPPHSIWMRDMKAAKPELVGLSAADEVLATYLPGGAQTEFPAGRAKWIPAGSDLILQMHYTATAAGPAVDQTTVSLRFSRAAVRERVVTLSVAQGQLEIPPGVSNYRAEARFTIQTAVELLAFTPHMHYRGKSMRVSALLPAVQDEEEVDLLDVPRYRFDWQLRYELRKPILAQRGTTILVEAEFDNSAGNRRNPDPTQTVRWGDQSWEEMLVCFVEVILPAGLPIEEIYREKRF